MSSTAAQLESGKWLQFVPNSASLRYWLDRLGHARLAAEDGKSFLPCALCHVMISGQYLIQGDSTWAIEAQNEFLELIGSEKVEKLWRTVTCQNREQFQERYSDYQASFCNDSSEDARLLVTILFVSNEGQLALRYPHRYGAWAWFWLADGAHKLAKLYLKRGEKHLAMELTNCMKNSVASLLLNCAIQKEIYDQQYLVRAFSYFQATISRQKRENLTRRIDSEIVPNEESIAAILNMASCYVKLRQPDKCQALLNQVRQLLNRSDLIDSESKLYFGAFADYLEGVNEFEDTCPLLSKLRASREVLFTDDDTLQRKYKRAKNALNRSASVMKEHFPYSPVIASALTMLGIVTANAAAEFGDEALLYLQEAVETEKKLSYRSNTLPSLIQALRIATRDPGAAAASNKEQWDSLLRQVLPLLQARANSTDEDVWAIASPENGSEAAPQEIVSSRACLVQTEDDDELMSSSLLPDITQFADCCRKECLDYFTLRLQHCTETHSTLAEVLCRLMIARYHLFHCAALQASYEQSRVGDIFNAEFSLRLTRQSSFTVEQIRGRLKSGDREKTETIALSISFWLANEAKIMLLDIQLINNWRLTRTVPISSSESSLKNTRSNIRNRLPSFIDSLKMRLWNSDWSVAKRLMERSRQLKRQLLPAMKQSQIGFDLCAMLDSYLTELCLDLNEALPSKLCRSWQVSRTRRALTRSLQQCISEAVNSTGTFSIAPVVSWHTLAVVNMQGGDQVDDASCITERFPRPHRILPLFQEAYDACTAAGLLDTALHARIHISVAIALYKAAILDVTKPAYSLYNAAVLKLRQAARILDLLEPNHPLTGDCYAMLAVLYFNMMQLDDQELKAMSCVAHCLKIERDLLANQCPTGKLAWRAIDVAQRLTRYFSASEYCSEWSELMKFAESIRDVSKEHHTSDRRNQLLSECSSFTAFQSVIDDKPLMAERFMDPIFAWEGKHHLKQTCDAMLGRVYPADNLPTFTEILCYSHYLLKLWNCHETRCDMVHGCLPNCRLTLTANDAPRRNDFLLGLNEYALASQADKERILHRLQKNHEVMLRLCKTARRFNGEFDTTG